MEYSNIANGEFFSPKNKRCRNKNRTKITQMYRNGEREKNSLLVLMCPIFQPSLSHTQWL